MPMSMSFPDRDPFDPHLYGDPDDATVQADTLRCARCHRYDETVNRYDCLCNRCYLLGKRLRVVEG